MFKNSGVNLQQISQTSKKNRINVATAYGFHPTKTFHNSNHHYQEGHLSQLRGKGSLLPFWGKNLHAAYLSARRPCRLPNTKKRVTSYDATLFLCSGTRD